jgi:GTPase SAR1 family protein
VIILGDSGVGKTALLNKLFINYLTNYLDICIKIDLVDKIYKPLD